VEAPIPFSHISSDFEDGEKKLLESEQTSEVDTIGESVLASEQTSGPAVDAIDNVALIPTSSALQSTLSVNSATLATIYVDENSSDEEDSITDEVGAINNVDEVVLPLSTAFIHDTVAAIINESTPPDDGDAEESSSDSSSVDVTIHNQDWPVEDLSDNFLPRATLIPMEEQEQDELIFEAIQVDDQEPSLRHASRKMAR
jgi:hypothetical protein